MAQNVEVGFTLMRCEALNDNSLKSYLSYLSKKKAKIETWDSEEPEDPNGVEKDQLLETGGFTIWFGKVEMNVSILMKTATFMGSVECPKSEKKAQRDSLQLLNEHATDLIELLKPKYGYADVVGDHPSDLGAAVSAQEVRWLFWTNFFGKEFVKKLGKKFLTDAPFVEAKESPGGTLTCTTRHLPFEKIEANRSKKLIEHFGGPDRVKIYYASEHPIEF